MDSTHRDGSRGSGHNPSGSLVADPDDVPIITGITPLSAIQAENERIPTASATIASSEGGQDTLPVVDASMVMSTRHAANANRRSITRNRRRNSVEDPTFIDRIPKLSNNKRICLGLAIVVSLMVLTSVLTSIGLVCGLGICSGEKRVVSSKDDDNDKDKDADKPPKIPPWYGSYFYGPVIPSVPCSADPDCSGNYPPTPSPTAYEIQTEDYPLTVDVSFLLASSNEPGLSDPSVMIEPDNLETALTKIADRLVFDLNDRRRVLLDDENNDNVASKVVLLGDPVAAHHDRECSVSCCIDIKHCYRVQGRLELRNVNHKTHPNVLDTCSKVSSSLQMMGVTVSTELFLMDLQMDQCHLQRSFDNNSASVSVDSSHVPSLVPSQSPSQSPTTTSPAPTPTSRIFRFDFDYTFFDDRVPRVDPTDQEVTALACQTQEWLSKELARRTNDPKLTIRVLELSYHRDDSYKHYFRLDFPVEFYAVGGDIDNGQPYYPTRDELARALDPMVIDSQEYLKDHIYASSPTAGTLNYFRNVNGFTMDVDYAVGVQTIHVEDVTCPELPRRVRFDLTFSFYEGFAPQVDPTESELGNLICATREWLNGLFDIYHGDDDRLLFWALFVSFDREDILAVSFLGKFMNAAGDEYIHTREELAAALDPNVMDSNDYILNHVAPSSSYFIDVNGVNFVADYDDGTPRDIVMDGCGATFSPTTSPAPTPEPEPKLLRFDFNFTFRTYTTLMEDGSSEETWAFPRGEPSKEDVQFLVCKMEGWLNDMLMDDRSLQMTAVDISYQRNSVDGVFSLSFLGDFKGPRGWSSTPSEANLANATSNSFLAWGYLYPTPVYFLEVADVILSVDWDDGTPRTIALKEGLCEGLLY